MIMKKLIGRERIIFLFGAIIAFFLHDAQTRLQISYNTLFLVRIYLWSAVLVIPIGVLFFS